jgi:hypothetical protein
LKEIVPMIRLRTWSVIACVAVVSLASQVRGEPSPQDAAKEKWLVDRALVVSPQAAPVPALKFRLFPMYPERKEGNAVPMYLRFAHERNDETKRMLIEKTDQWNALPLEKLPVAEAGHYLEQWKYNLNQLELGARRKTADWAYSLDVEDVVGIRLPDAQEMRLWAKLLALQARWQIAEHKPADAVRTLETGFSFSEQVGKAPFLINALVGIACASQFEGCLLDLMEQPDAPNLYWALTVLPRPLIDLRQGMDFEQQVTELQVRDLADVDRPRSAEEWDATLVRVRKQIEELAKFDEEPQKKRIVPGARPHDSAAKAPDLGAGKQYLVQKLGVPAATVETMPASQVMVLYIARYSKEIRDNWYKAAYLPLRDARHLLALAEKETKLPDNEAWRLARMLLPAIDKVLLAQARLERRLATLRVIEALRLHAAAHDGQLPEHLDQVTIVPVPNDPGTDKPFEYHLDGQTATLTSRIADQPIAMNGLRYRVTIRK